MIGAIYKYIEQYSPIRYIDSFVDSQDFDEQGFNHVSQENPDKGGRPPYEPRDMLKLIGKLTPYYYTIADF